MVHEYDKKLHFVQGKIKLTGQRLHQKKKIREIFSRLSLFSPTWETVFSFAAPKAFVASKGSASGRGIG